MHVVVAVVMVPMIVRVIMVMIVPMVMIVVVVVVMIMVVIVGMIVPMMMVVPMAMVVPVVMGMTMPVHLHLAVRTSANRTHHAASKSLILISSPPCGISLPPPQSGQQSNRCSISTVFMQS